MTDVGKREDLLLEKISSLVIERDLALRELAEERVAHRITKKELQETVTMVLK